MLSQTYFCWCIAFMYSTFLWIELWIEIEFKPLNVCIGINIWVEAWRINKAFCMEQPLIITLDSSGLTRYGSFCYKTFPPIGWSSFFKKNRFSSLKKQVCLVLDLGGCGDCTSLLRTESGYKREKVSIRPKIYCCDSWLSGDLSPLFQVAQSLNYHLNSCNPLM